MAINRSIGSDDAEMRIRYLTPLQQDITCVISVLPSKAILQCFIFNIFVLFPSTHRAKNVSIVYAK